MFFSTGVPGSLEEMIRGLSGTEMEMDYEEGQGEVKDLEHGVKEGGKVGCTWVWQTGQCVVIAPSLVYPFSPSWYAGMLYIIQV